MLPRLCAPAVLPAERANFDSKDAPFLDPSQPMARSTSEMIARLTIINKLQQAIKLNSNSLMYLLRHSLRLLVLLLTLSLGVGGRLFGQYYPVHATVQWPSPQSPHLVDYYSGSRDRLIITLHNRGSSAAVTSGSLAFADQE